jgi:outer membrane protein TolC
MNQVKMDRSSALRTGLLVPALFLPLIVLSLVQAQQRPAARPVKTIGVIFDGRPPEGEVLGLKGTEREFDMIRQEILALVSRDFDARFPDDKQLYGGWHVAGIDSALDQLLSDPEIDLVLAMGVISTNDLAHRSELPKPVIGCLGIDIALQGLPFDGESSGLKNLNYVTLPTSVIMDLRRFHELLRFSKIHIVHHALISDLLPTIEKYVQEGVRDLGVEIVPIPAVSSAQEILDALPGDTEAVYVTPLPRMTVTEVDRLIAGLSERRIPGLSLIGRQAVERGLLASLAPETSFDILARRVALNAQRILRGEDAGTLPVILDSSEKLTINMETARQIGWSPNWFVLTEATLLNEEISGIERRLSLAAAVNEAIAANLDLKATDRGVAAGEQDVKEARSALLPQLDLSALGLRIDQDRAEASFGSQPERTVSGSATLQQLLYSDAALGNVRIQSRLQEARVFDRERVMLDVALEAAESFLGVLRAQTLLDIQKENARLTESNLEIARRRQTIGVSGPAEVYRWESQLANNRREVNAADQRLRAARAALNRVLHRPLEEPFLVEEPDLDDPSLRTGRGRLLPYVDNPRSFGVFRDFAVKEGLAASPELKSLDEAIAAKERELLVARRSFWSPDIALFGDITRQLSESGAGTEGLELKLQSDTPPISFPEADDTDWSAGVTFSLPLYTGGERAARLRRARQELAQLRLERESAAEAIELRIRLSMYDVATSSPAIEWNRDAAEAARKNLELVTDVYSQGLASIIDLLDAQNSALVADQLAANAEYDFLTDLMRSQRTLNNFDFFLSSEEREAWFDRLEAFFEEAEGRSGPYGR